MIKYIIRLDDACPTMNWKKWNRIIHLLDKFDIKPIIAVIPNNEDKSLMIDTSLNDFWEIVKEWEVKGYHIAMHGYNHVYISKKKGLVPINNRSEFAGVDYELQQNKIVRSWKIFRENGLTPNIWVAPAHSFDLNTIKILKHQTSISIISDGISIKPFNKGGFLWIPQQLWKPKKKSIGVWTICYHPNSMNENDFNILDNFLSIHHKKFLFDLNQIKMLYSKRQKSIIDKTYEYFFF